MLPRDCPDVDKECRPSNSMIGSTDRQIVYLLLLQPLRLLAMPGVMMMPTTLTLGFMILYLCLSCQVTFACTIFIIVIIIIYTNPSGSPAPDAPFSVHLVRVAAVEFEDCTGCLFTGCLFTGCPFPDCLHRHHQLLHDAHWFKSISILHILCALQKLACRAARCF